LFDPETGKHGINIDDIAWKNYVDKDNSKRVNKKAPAQSTESKVKRVEPDNKDRFNNLLLAVIFVIKKKYKPTDKEMQKLTDDISKRFEGMGN
jgi:hypothetical protein